MFVPCSYMGLTHIQNHKASFLHWQTSSQFTLPSSSPSITSSTCIIFIEVMGKGLSSLVALWLIKHLPSNKSEHTFLTSMPTKCPKGTINIIALPATAMGLSKGYYICLILLQEVTTWNIITMCLPGRKQCDRTKNIVLHLQQHNYFWCAGPKVCKRKADK